MIIKEDKLAQAEADAEQQGESLPPYSASPHVQVNVAEPSPSTAPPNDRQSHAAQSTSVAASSTAVAASSSGSGSDTALNPQDPYFSIKSPPNILRRSYLRLQRSNRPISERIIIDPYLPFPPNINANGHTSDGGEEDEEFGPRFGSPVPGDPDKKNVRIECKNGTVNAEIWVVGAPNTSVDLENDETGAKKAGIDIRGKNGFIHVKMHASKASPPFALRVAAKNAGVRVELPRSFVGPLTTRTRNGWTTLSPELASCVTSFSEVRGSRKSFIGDFVESNYGKGDWLGSSLDITCDNGRIRLCYVDEEVANTSFLGRLFK